MNHPNSVSRHEWATLGDIDNKVIAVGDHYRNNEVEVFDIKSNTWTMQTSCPYCSYQ